VPVALFAAMYLDEYRTLSILLNSRVLATPSTSLACGIVLVLFALGDQQLSLEDRHVSLLPLGTEFAPYS